MVSAALVIMATAIMMLGSMSWENLAKGLLGIAGAMTILVVAANAMEEAAPGAISMVIMAGAIAILAGALKKIGNMSWETSSRDW